MYWVLIFYFFSRNCAAWQASYDYSIN